MVNVALSIGADLKAQWVALSSRAQETADAEKVEELTEFMKRLEADKQAAQEEQEREAELVSKRVGVSDVGWVGLC